jgi:hypothetical protein
MQQNETCLYTVAATTEAAGTSEAAGTTEAATDSEAVTGVKAGFIFLHDENSTYDLNFLNGAKAACEKLGIEYMTKTNIPEGQEAYEAACELADAGCNFIFADSFGHEDYITHLSLILGNITVSDHLIQLHACNDTCKVTAIIDGSKCIEIVAEIRCMSFGACCVEETHIGVFFCSSHDVIFMSE